MGVGRRKKQSIDDFEQAHEHGPNLENIVKQRRDGSIDICHRLHSDRLGDQYLGVADCFRDEGDITEAAEYYDLAREHHMKRAANPRQADAETYVALFLICDGLRKCGREGLSDEKTRHFRSAVDEYYNMLEKLGENDNLMRYVIFLRISELSKRMGFGQWADRIRGDAEQYKQSELA